MGSSARRRSPGVEAVVSGHSFDALVGLAGRGAKRYFANVDWFRAYHQINDLSHRCGCRLATSLHVHQEMNLPLVVRR
jgi:hypothetical protein